MRQEAVPDAMLNSTTAMAASKTQGHSQGGCLVGAIGGNHVPFAICARSHGPGPWRHVWKGQVLGSLQ